MALNARLPRHAGESTNGVAWYGMCVSCDELTTILQLPENAMEGQMVREQEDRGEETVLMFVTGRCHHDIVTA